MEIKFHIPTLTNLCERSVISEYIERCLYSDESPLWRVIYDADYIVEALKQTVSKGGYLPVGLKTPLVKAVVTDIKIIEDDLVVKISFSGDDEFSTRRAFLNDLSVLTPLVVKSNSDRVMVGFAIADKFNYH